MIHNLSYRFKLPICIVAASTITAVTAVIVISWSYYIDSKNRMVSHSQELGYSMMGMLAWSLKNDDIWHAYSLLRGPKENVQKKPSRTLVLIDKEDKVFASNQPKSFPIGSKLSGLASGALPFFAHQLLNSYGGHEFQEISDANYTLSFMPVLSDNTLLGKLLIVDSHNSISAVISRISFQGFMVVLVLLGALAPAGWYWGNRMIKPLLQLESCVARLGQEPIDNIHCFIPHDRDEIGRLSLRFQQMLNDLKQKLQLEQQLIVSDRLAAVGTLAAGVAHEINNPLGGMIVALDTYKQYCNSSRCSQREEANASIALVERGLSQIKSITAALLVNTDIKDKPLAPEDIEDVYKLISPEVKNKMATISWNNEIHSCVDVSSTMIRQILFNLLLNAVHATHTGGNIDFHIYIDNGNLLIEVKNDGKCIPIEDMSLLFEPFYTTGKKGSGLGLWITHQVIQKLRGQIAVSRDDDSLTVFKVVIPVDNNQGGDWYGNSNS